VGLDYIIKGSMKKIREQLCTTHFIYSKGWLHHFEQHHGLPQHVKHGEMAQISAEGCKKITAKEAHLWVAKIISIPNRTV
jgi:hypothetical protein